MYIQTQTLRNYQHCHHEHEFCKGYQGLRIIISEQELPENYLRVKLKCIVSYFGKKQSS